jgi:hypothetical protein
LSGVHHGKFRLTIGFELCDFFLESRGRLEGRTDPWRVGGVATARSGNWLADAGIGRWIGWQNGKKFDIGHVDSRIKEEGGN